MTKIFKSFAIKSPIVRGKKRYLCGVATGLKQDSHGERMSGACIRSIIKQSKEKDFLLFPDEHGIRESEDIGILHNLKQLPNGDVYVEFRLYDKTDKVDARSIETADKLWAQAGGLPPYTRPREKGFSIEGYIPEDRKDLEAKRESEGVIDDMKVEGFVVVPEPAYENSVIQTVEKSKNIAKERNVKNTVQKSISPKEEDLLQKIQDELDKLKVLKGSQSLKNEIVEAGEEGENAPEDPEGDFLDNVEKGEENLNGEEDPEFNEFEEKEEIEKRNVKKSETGRASAEEKLETLSEEDERALQVLKSLMGSVRKARRVPEETAKYFNETHKVLKSAFAKINKQQRRIDQLEDAVEGMLEGMGITQKVLQTGTRQKVRKSGLSPDAEAIVNALGSAVHKSARSRSEPDYSADMGADGSLGDVMKKLFNH